MEPKLTAVAVVVASGLILSTFPASPGSNGGPPPRGPPRLAIPTVVGNADLPMVSGSPEVVPGGGRIPAPRVFPEARPPAPKWVSGPAKVVAGPANRLFGAVVTAAPVVMLLGPMRPPGSVVVRLDDPKTLPGPLEVVVGPMRPDGLIPGGLFAVILMGLRGPIILIGPPGPLGGSPAPVGPPPVLGPPIILSGLAPPAPTVILIGPPLGPPPEGLSPEGPPAANGVVPGPIGPILGPLMEGPPAPLAGSLLGPRADIGPEGPVGRIPAEPKGVKYAHLYYSINFFAITMFKS